MPNPKPNLAGSARININNNTGWLLGANLPWIKCGGNFRWEQISQILLTATVLTPLLTISIGTTPTLVI
jgi:hypothetical protein